MQQYIRIQSYEMFLQNKSLKNYALFCCDETNVTNNFFDEVVKVIIYFESDYEQAKGVGT